MLSVFYRWTKKIFFCFKFGFYGGRGNAIVSLQYSTTIHLLLAYRWPARHILSDHSQVEWRQLVLQRTSSAEERLSDSECTVVYLVVHARQGAERERLEVGWCAREEFTGVDTQRAGVLDKEYK